MSLAPLPQIMMLDQVGTMARFAGWHVMLNKKEMRVFELPYDADGQGAMRCPVLEPKGMPQDVGWLLSLAGKRVQILVDDGSRAHVLSPTVKQVILSVSPSDRMDAVLILEGQPARSLGMRPSLAKLSPARVVTGHDVAIEGIGGDVASIILAAFGRGVATLVVEGDDILLQKASLLQKTSLRLSCGLTDITLSSAMPTLTRKDIIVLSGDLAWS